MRSDRDHNGQLRCRACRHREEAINEYPHYCPVCGESALYATDLDRYVHIDGSSNRDCWVELARAAS